MPIGAKKEKKYNRKDPKLMKGEKIIDHG